MQAKESQMMYEVSCSIINFRSFKYYENAFVFLEHSMF